MLGALMCKDTFLVKKNVFAFLECVMMVNVTTFLYNTFTLFSLFMG